MKPSPSSERIPVRGAGRGSVRLGGVGVLGRRPAKRGPIEGWGAGEGSGRLGGWPDPDAGKGVPCRPDTKMPGSIGFRLWPGCSPGRRCSLSYSANPLKKMERVMRFELTTSTLARLRSTPELHPHPFRVGNICVVGPPMQVLH